MEMTEAQLARDGWPNAEEVAAGFTQPRFSCLIAEPQGGGEPCGFALFFFNYSTWQVQRPTHGPTAAPVSDKHTCHSAQCLLSDRQTLHIYSWADGQCLVCVAAARGWLGNGSLPRGSLRVAGCEGCGGWHGADQGGGSGRTGQGLRPAAVAGAMVNQSSLCRHSNGHQSGNHTHLEQFFASRRCDLQIVAARKRLGNQRANVC